MENFKGAIGVLETKGFVSIVESVDAMLKASNVTILGQQRAGAGLVCIFISGDIGSVRVAIDAGYEAGKKSGNDHLKATIIANPASELVEIVTNKDF